MGPSRSKRARTKPSLEEQSMSPDVDIDSALQAGSSTEVEKVIPRPKVVEKDPVIGEKAASSIKPAKAGVSSNKQLKSKSSWYGTWPRKSTASTQVAKESILADKPTNGSSADLSRFETKKITTTASRPPAMYLGKSRETLDMTMGGTFEAQNTIAKVEAAKTTVGEGNQDIENKEVVNSTSTGTIPSRPVSVSNAASQRPSTSSGWLGSWLSRPAPPYTQAAVECQNETNDLTAQIVPEQAGHGSSKLIQVDGAEIQTTATAGLPTEALSWFGLWSTAAPSAAADATTDEIPVKTGESSQDMVMEDAPTTDQPNTGKSSAGTSWAFWSTDSKKQASSPSNTVGELAVVGESSQNQPEAAKTVPAASTSRKDNKKTTSGKRSRPLSGEVEEIPRTISEQAESKASTTQSSSNVKVSPPNLLLPSVKSTYRLMENPSILQQIAQLIMHGQQKPVKHVFLVKDPPKIKKALAIGIHGLFPAQFLRTVIGQPTGTSIRFANHAAEAIRRWTNKHGDVECEIEKVALEGEGKIADRVDNLWKLLLNWIDHVRKADFILVACHSQGVPVAMMLVSKLIEFGVVTTGKIGVCAMAGVSLGPFPDYKSRLLSGSAGELFEFADSESVVSKRYEDSLRVAVKYGVKITYCGSIDDQLVSMESSTFSPISHPYIFRAVFVDGRIHAPDFLCHLVGFALKLRNLGVSDHGLIRELSAPLAGSLYTGEGHSRLYDDGNVYDLAIEYALETTIVGDFPLDIEKYEIPTNANPYILPWIMRGLLEEDFVKTELDHETMELLKEFDDWKPSTKVLKDVKYRLEAVRSKL